MGESKNKEYLQILLTHLEETDNAILRNAIAIALADIGDSSSVDLLIRLIEDPRTKGNRGTLLYALQSLEYSSHAITIAKLVSSNSFEVSRQSLLLLVPIINSLPEQVRNECKKIIGDDLLQDEKNEFLKEAFELLF